MTMNPKKQYRVKTWLSLLLLLLGCGLVWWFARPTKPAPAEDGANAASTDQLKRAVALGKSNVLPAQPPAGVPDQKTPPTEASEYRGQQIRTAAQALNVPVSFWGKVLDQNSNGVAEVKIVATIRQWSSGGGLTVRPNSVNYNRQTDSSGLFEITGGNGDSLRIESIAKEGYVMSPKAQISFGYNISTNHTPEPRNPVVLRLWKTGVPQPLVSHRLSRLAIPVDGTPQYFDLMTGKRSADQGDLRVVLFRTPVNLITASQRHDWILTVEIEKGGLLLSEDEFLLAAPQDGYQKTIRFEMSKNDATWTPILKKQFYINIRGDLFGKLSLSCSTDRQRPTGSATLECSINPSGDTSLEGGVKTGPSNGIIE